MTAPSTKSGKHRSTGDVVTDLWNLTRDYAKQETIDPLKAIGTFLAYGVPGALLLGLGGFFFSLGVLRLLQEETGAHLTGSWSWVPYLVTFAVDVLVIAILVVAIKRTGKAKVVEAA